MITKQSSSYAKLFEKAKTLLKQHNPTEDIIIDDIDDYFCYIKTLAELENSDSSIDPIFTILPATEETFFIDANKRTITIPSAFAKNGVAVQGDEIAEILYFSIDRYFDAMDLADMDIIIQWRHENNSDDDNVFNLSATYKKSLTLSPGQIVFGWPITSEITENPGNIQFSIRFYRRGKDQNEKDILVYSFSTLTATIKIQKGLNFDILDPILTMNTIDKTQQVYNNIRNSTPTNIDKPIAVPVFVERWTKTSDSDDLVPAENKPYEDLINFVARASFAPSTSEEEYINTNGLVYSWREESNKDTVLPESAFYYRPVNTQKETYDAKTIYYYQNEGAYEPYSKLGDPNCFDDEVELFVRCSIYEPVKAGKYYAVAENKQSLISFKFANSDSWEIKGPNNPIFTDNHADDKVLLEAGTTTIEIDVEVNGDMTSDEWYKGTTAAFSDATKIEGASGNSYEASEEGYYFRKVTNTKNAVSIDGISSPIWARHKASPIGELRYTINNELITNLVVQTASQVEVKFDQLLHSDRIEYQWYKDNKAIDTDDGKKSYYTLTEAGSYYCIITNHYKDTSSESVQSDLLVRV